MSLHLCPSMECAMSGHRPPSATWQKTLTTQDCPDDAPDGKCWDCRANKNEPHRDGCPTRIHQR
jgi:hypothetical protein